MAGGGDDVSCAQQPGRGERRGHRQKAAWLPLDVIAEIAARSDPATLVRCAATCRDARRRIAEGPSLLGRLRLRDTERFVLPLLRGHLAGTSTYIRGEGEKINVYMVDTTGAADATRLVKASFTKADETLKNVSMDSRGGLVLVNSTTMTAQNNKHQQKLVCNLTTRRFVALPPEPAFPYAKRSPDWSITHGVQYVLLVDGSDGEGAGADSAVGRPFQVLKAQLILSQYRSYCCLLVHTFSSEHGAWSPLIEIPTPSLQLQGSGYYTWHRRLVVGDVVHWLCLTKYGSYMLILHVGAARVNVTSLPASFPRNKRNQYYPYQYLLATAATAGGNPVVLVADTDKVSAWEQSKHTKIWKLQPQVVIENETILGFNDDRLAELVEKNRSCGKKKHVLELLWFGERSGTVLLGINGYGIYCLLWLDLHSKKIVRCFSSDRQMKVYCPYEVDLLSWVPTFNNAVTL